MKIQNFNLMFLLDPHSSTYEVNNLLQNTVYLQPRLFLHQPSCTVATILSVTFDQTLKSSPSCSFLGYREGFPANTTS